MERNIESELKWTFIWGYFSVYDVRFKNEMKITFLENIES